MESIDKAYVTYQTYQGRLGDAVSKAYQAHEAQKQMAAAPYVEQYRKAYYDAETPEAAEEVPQNLKQFQQIRDELRELPEDERKKRIEELQQLGEADFGLRKYVSSETFKAARSQLFEASLFDRINHLRALTAPHGWVDEERLKTEARRQRRNEVLALATQIIDDVIEHNPAYGKDNWRQRLFAKPDKIRQHQIDKLQTLLLGFDPAPTDLNNEPTDQSIDDKFEADLKNWQAFEKLRFAADVDNLHTKALRENKEINPKSSYDEAKQIVDEINSIAEYKDVFSKAYEIRPKIPRDHEGPNIQAPEMLKTAAEKFITEFNASVNDGLDESEIRVIKEAIANKVSGDITKDITSPFIQKNSKEAFKNLLLLYPEAKEAFELYTTNRNIVEIRQQNYQNIGSFVMNYVYGVPALANQAYNIVRNDTTIFRPNRSKAMRRVTNEKLQISNEELQRRQQAARRQNLFRRYRQRGPAETTINY